jgi:hypothetical protein
MNPSDRKSSLSPFLYPEECGALGRKPNEMGAGTQPKSSLSPFLTLRFIDPLGLERVEICSPSEPCIPVDVKDETEKEALRQNLKPDPLQDTPLFPFCDVFPTVCGKAVDKAICAITPQACVYIFPDQIDPIKDPTGGEPQANLPIPDPIGAIVPPVGATIIPPILPPSCSPTGGCSNGGSGSMGSRK